MLAAPPVEPVIVTPENVASPSNSNITMSPEPLAPPVPLPSKVELVMTTAWTPAWAKPPPGCALVSVRPDTNRPELPLLSSVTPSSSSVPRMLASLALMPALVALATVRFSKRTVPETESESRFTLKP